jgi:hypothetical protein
VTVATPDHPTDAVAPPEPRRRRNPWVTGVLVVVCLGIAAMWVYGLWFANRHAAYRVDDPEWRRAAEEVCARAEERRLALFDTEDGYIAHPTDAQMIERADVVDRATDILDQSLAELRAIPVASERDRRLVAEYAGFYDVLLADRRAYTAQLRSLELAPYRESLIAGGPVTNVILDFTTVNEIPSCQPPGELGGDT